MNDHEPTYAFTTKSNNGLRRQLINEVVIESGGKTKKEIALWDTGASGTCISSETVKALGMIPTGKRNIKTPSGCTEVNTYLTSILLPNNVEIQDVEVCDSEIGNQGIGVLVGMDIITMGDFAVSNHLGNTVFSFRIPSKKTTDYVAELSLQKRIGSHGKGKRKRK